MEFKHLPFTNGHPNSDKIIQKPEQFELMIELARALSKGLPHVRVDFTNLKGRYISVNLLSSIGAVWCRLNRRNGMISFVHGYGCLIKRDNCLSNA